MIQSPVINTVPGAMPIQEVIEHTEWVSQSGNPVAYAPHIRKTPLAGVPAKSVIYQFAKGDQIVPNPATTALLRAGDLADRATFYRHDLAFAENPQLPTNPHGFLATTRHPSLFGRSPGRPGADRDLLRHRTARRSSTRSRRASSRRRSPGRCRRTSTSSHRPAAEHVADDSITEGDGGDRTVTFTVSLSAPSSQPVTVNYATADGTATAGGRLRACFRDAHLRPGETTKTITVVINPDRKKEANETFFVDLAGRSTPFCWTTWASARSLMTISQFDRELLAVRRMI